MDPAPRRVLTTVRADVEALAAIERRSASAGEREAAEWVAGRLREAGAADVALQPFRCQHTFAYTQGVHLAAGIVAAKLGGRLGAALALGALASYDADFSGRSQWLRRFLPSTDGTNVIAHVPAWGERRRTVVLVVHHDAAHTGAMWDPRLGAAAARRAAAGSDALPSYAAVPAAALMLVAAGSLARRRAVRRVGAGLLAGVIALLADVARGPVVPGASDNASGIASMLALVERFAAGPLDGTDVMVVSTGCEESGMGGMAAWMRSAGARLDPATTLVLGLDTLGAGRPTIVDEEGGVRGVRYGEQELALADRAADSAGLEKPRRFRIGGWTDPVLARLADLPAISLVSTAPGGFTNYHLPTDTVDRVDWESVDRCTTLARAIVEQWSRADTRPVVRARRGGPPRGA